MPEEYCDYWWEDLPESARKAAELLGYTEETWDEDEHVPYDAASFLETTPNQRAAALFLGMPVINSKLDVDWNELDETTQKHATTLTWTQELWDDDYDIEDLECNNWYWKDMTEEQKEAARYFGYTRITWDETEEDVFELIVPAGDEDAEETASPSPAAAAAAAPEPKPEKKTSGPKKQGQSAEAKAEKKKNYSVSKFYGGESGKVFDHGNHRFIEAVEVFGKHVVTGIKVTYINHQVYKAGDCDGKSHKVELATGEYINKVAVRDDDKNIQELTFFTSTGQTHGPFGGHGGLLHKAGEVKELRAPLNAALCGFLGRETSKHITAIAFRWGPASDVPKK
jgi:hypothetical protein